MDIGNRINHSSDGDDKNETLNFLYTSIWKIVRNHDKYPIKSIVWDMRVKVENVTVNEFEF